MSHHGPRESDCYGKMAYTKRGADAAIRALHRARRNRQKRLREYVCPYCHHYHLTSQRAPVAQ